jgi:hypothetical protein
MDEDVHPTKGMHEMLQVTVARLLINIVGLACSFLVTTGAGRLFADEPESTSKVRRAEIQLGPEIQVGILEGDVRGADHRALQAAVDYIAGLGGGTVRIGPGRYQMRDALKLRDNVRLIGVPGEAVLVACDGFVSSLLADGDANERYITVEDASGFRVGDGVTIEDRESSGFAVTTATLISQTDSNTFRLSAPLYLDYLVSRKAMAKLAFPVIGGW